MGVVGVVVAMMGKVVVFGQIVNDTHTTPGTEMVLAMVMLAVIVVVILTVVVTTVIEFVITTVVAVTVVAVTVVAVGVVAWKGGGTVDQTLSHPYDE